ncbi:hypothetical protein ACA910_014573 [Epithemia clementina (nom. ined.)]
MSSDEQVSPDLEKQNAKFGYKAPESVYKNRIDPKNSMLGKGQAFQGVSPMDFYLRQNAQKKAQKEKEHDTKVGMYKNNLFKSAF